MSVKWSAFPSGTTIAGTDITVGLQSGANVQWTWSQALTYVTGGAATSMNVTGGTVTSSTPTFNATQTWNAGGVTFTGLKLNVTDSASASASLLVDLQVQNSSKVNFTKAGLSKFADGAAWSLPSTLTSNVTGYLAPVGVFASQSTSYQGLVVATASSAGNATITMMASGGTLASPTAQAGAGMAINFVNYVGGAVADWKEFAIIEGGNRGGAPTAAADVLGRIQLGAVNGTGTNPRPGLVVYNDSITVTNGVPLYLYNTGHANVYDGNTGDYEYAAGSWATNVFSFGPVAGGTGTLRRMQFVGSQVSVNIAGSVGAPSLTLQDTATGFFRPGGNIWQFACNGVGALQLEGNNGILFRSDYGIGWSSNTSFAAADVQLFRGAANALDLLGGSTPRLNFGGHTSSFSALKRSSATLQTRLGDDSDYAQHAAAYWYTAKAYTVSGLPAGSVGFVARVTDASAPAVGSTVTGGGAAAALVWYNGANYTVIGV